MQAGKATNPSKRVPKTGAAAASLAAELERSRQFEMKAYIEQMDGLYRTHLAHNGVLFDIAAGLTDHFRGITAESIVEDSRVIKIGRYCVAPSISQMKFGQFFGLASPSRRRSLPRVPSSTNLSGSRPASLTSSTRTWIALDSHGWIGDSRRLNSRSPSATREAGRAHSSQTRTPRPPTVRGERPLKRIASS
jgi:hypothetical protein